jgi:uncharacterized protein YbaP (TraB family)
MRPIVPALLALSLMAGPAAALAQYDTVSPIQPPPDGTAAEEWGEITITHHYPGPALWRVKKGNSEVYILGGLPVMEKRLDWDRSRMDKILGQANVLLTSPKAKGGIRGFAAWQMTKGNGFFKTLYDVLPPDVGGHFWRTAKKNGLDPQAYAKESPVVAVMKLRDDIYEKNGLSTNDPEKMLIFMARAKHTPMKPIATYSAANLIGKLGAMSKDDKFKCVTAALNEIDFAVGHAVTASRAWAVADLNTARANTPNSATLACLEGAGSTREMLDRATNDTVAAINEALDKPGKSVVAFPLSILLRPNGALDRLRAQGLEVAEPES